MRTTLIIKDDTMTRLKDMAARESRTLGDVVTDALNRGLGQGARESAPWKCATYDLGGGFDYSRAWQRIDELESDAVAEKLDLRK